MNKKKMILEMSLCLQKKTKDKFAPAYKYDTHLVKS